MDVATLRSMLFWCTLMNFGFLAIWGLLMWFPHEWVYRLWSRRVRLSTEQFDLINFAGIVLFKLLIIGFNLVPYLALLLVERGFGS